jgi:hypothetical protein
VELLLHPRKPWQAPRPWSIVLQTPPALGERRSASIEDVLVGGHVSPGCNLPNRWIRDPYVEALG